MKKLLFIFAVLCGTMLMAETPVACFAPGERVVFFGDSITHGGGYIFHIQMFEDLRYPGSGTVMMSFSPTYMGVLMESRRSLFISTI